MRENNSAKIRLGTLRYEGQVENITHDEAEELRVDQISRIYEKARLIKGLR